MHTAHCTTATGLGVFYKPEKCTLFIELPIWRGYKRGVTITKQAILIWRAFWNPNSRHCHHDREMYLDSSWNHLCAISLVKEYRVKRKFRRVFWVDEELICH